MDKGSHISHGINWNIRGNGGNRHQGVGVRRDVLGATNRTNVDRDNVQHRLPAMSATGVEDQVISWQCAEILNNDKVDLLEGGVKWAKTLS